MDINQKNKTKLYTIIFIIGIIVLCGIYFNRKDTEDYYSQLVYSKIHEYDNKANFDIKVTVLDKFNEVSVKLMPSDSYTTKQYGQINLTFNKKSKNFVRSTSVKIPDRVFE